MAVLAIGGEVDGIARTFKGGAQLPPEIGFVFDDQDTHSRLPGAVHLRAVNPSCGERLLIRNNWELRSKCQLRARISGRASGVRSAPDRRRRPRSRAPSA